MVYKHAVVAAFHMYAQCGEDAASVKEEVGGHTLNSHGKYIVDHGKSWNYGIVILNFYRPLFTHPTQHGSSKENPMKNEAEIFYK